MHSRYVCAVPVLHVGKKKWSRERGAYHFGVARRGDEEQRRRETQFVDYPLFLPRQRSLLYKMIGVVGGNG